MHKSCKMRCWSFAHRNILGFMVYKCRILDLCFVISLSRSSFLSSTLVKTLVLHLIGLPGISLVFVLPASLVQVSERNLTLFHAFLKPFASTIIPASNLTNLFCSNCSVHDKNMPFLSFGAQLQHIQKLLKTRRASACQEEQQQGRTEHRFHII